MADRKFTREQWQALTDLANKAKPLMLKDAEGAVSETRADREYTIAWDAEKVTFALKQPTSEEED